MRAKHLPPWAPREIGSTARYGGLADHLRGEGASGQAQGRSVRLL